jgi:hypothetical protein
MRVPNRRQRVSSSRRTNRKTRFSVMSGQRSDPFVGDTRPARALRQSRRKQSSPGDDLKDDHAARRERDRVQPSIDPPATQLSRDLFRVVAILPGVGHKHPWAVDIPATRHLTFSFHRGCTKHHPRQDNSARRRRRLRRTTPARVCQPESP